MSISRRILTHVALGAALVIAVVAAATYLLVFRTAERRALEHLDTYVTERMRREESGFQVAYSRLEVVRGLFLARDAMPVPADIQERWDALIHRDPDGGWRSAREAGDPSLWGHRDLKLTPKIQHRMLIALDVTRELMPTWEKTFPSVYLSFPGSAVIGFNPDQLSWAWDTPADYPVEEQDWYNGALPENNPLRGFVWTSIYRDPTSGLPFATLMLPIERDGEFICTLAHDMRLERLFTEVTQSEFPAAEHIILRGDGRIIAHPEMRDVILASEGTLTAQEAGDPALANLYRLVNAAGGRAVSGVEPLSDSYFLAARFGLPGADWFFVTTMPRSVVQAQAFESARWVWISGLASLALLLAAFAIILRRQVSRPLAELTRASHAMAAGTAGEAAISARADELGELASAFRDMNAKVAARENELRQLNASLEQRVTDRTSELARANQRLADSLRAEKELNQLKSSFVSMVSHEFRTPLGIILSSSNILDRYLERLPPEKRSAQLRAIRKSVHRMNDLIDDVLMLGKLDAAAMSCQPSPVNLEETCRRIISEVESAASRAGYVRFTAMGLNGAALADEGLLMHILTNILSNALKYSPPDQPVEFTVTRRGFDAEFILRDCGCGIPASDLSRLFTAFYRGSNVGQKPGSGLGLVIAKRCVDLHGGTIDCQSEEGKGTTFTVTLPLFRPAPPRASAPGSSSDPERIPPHEINSDY